MTRIQELNKEIEALEADVDRWMERANVEARRADDAESLAAERAREIERLKGGETLRQQREALAALAHEQWSGWMDYLFSKCKLTEMGDAVIPKSCVLWWQRQMGTTYADLSEVEKDSDRKEADRVIALLAVSPEAPPQEDVSVTAPTEDEINTLEKVAWDAGVDRALVWYRDQIDHLRARLREADVAMKLERTRAIRAEKLLAEAPPAPAPEVKGADHTWECGCYSFCGNLVACPKHFPSAPAPAPSPSAGKERDHG